MIRRKVSNWILFVVLTSLLFTVGSVAFATPSEDYGEYSLMSQRHAGLFYADGNPAGQWSWTPQPTQPQTTQSRTTQGDVSVVSWGDPAKPPDSVEWFIHSGNWVLLDGYGDPDHGAYYVQRVHQELIGDESCRNLVPLPSDGGRQHYAQWTVPPRAYCLQARGTITELLSGKTIMDFSHTQVWSPPGSCRNTYLGAQICIRQWESWWDNKDAPGTPITRKIERSVSLARGVGMGFVIDQTYPHPWHSELHADWSW